MASMGNRSAKPCPSRINMEGTNLTRTLHPASEISAEMMSLLSDTPMDTVKGLFVMKAVIKRRKSIQGRRFSGRKILLVHEETTAHGRSPGGWCDVDQSVSSNVTKEVKEETGLDVTAIKLITDSGLAAAQ